MAALKKYRLGRLDNLGDVVKALGRTIRCMADGTIDSQLGARICNSLGILRASLETATLLSIEQRLQQLQITARAKDITPALPPPDNDRVDFTPEEQERVHSHLRPN